MLFHPVTSSNKAAVPSGKIAPNASSFWLLHQYVGSARQRQAARLARSDRARQDVRQPGSGQVYRAVLMKSLQLVTVHVSPYPVGFGP